MKRLTFEELKIGAKVMIADRKTIGGMDLLVYVPAVLERDYREDPDFDGSFLVKLEHNGKSYGAHSGNIFERVSDKPLLVLP